MIVEVLIDGVTKYRWPGNENRDINSGHIFKIKCELREKVVKEIVDRVRREVIPNLKESGKLEIFTVFESKFPADDLEEEVNAYKPQLINLKTPYKAQGAVKKLMETYNKSEEGSAPFIRPKAEYSNRQHISNY